MSNPDKQYEIPSDRVNRVWSILNPMSVTHEDVKNILEAFAADCAENPVVPTDAQDRELYADECGNRRGVASVVMLWQRRMFEAPEPEVRDAVKDLLWDLTNSGWQVTGDKHNLEIIEAYRRGKAGK